MGLETKPLHTQLCDILEIEHPVISAGMGFVARAELAAAVSEAGGLGVIGGAGLTPKRLREEIRKTRQLTDRPFGVDLLLPLQGRERTGRIDPGRLAGLEGEFAVDANGELVRPEDLMEVVMEETPPVFASGLGDPGPWVSELHAGGTVVMSLVGTVRAALRVAHAGVDVIVAQGTEAGGHTGRVSTMALVPAIVDAVTPRPVVAAGGISDGRGLAAALCLGACGVWMGTRFVATQEACGHPRYKEAILAAGEDATVVTRSYSGKPMRVIRNAWTDQWEDRSPEILPFPDQFRHSAPIYASARRDGDTEVGSMPCGQGAHAITELLPAGEVVRQVVTEAARCWASAVRQAQPEQEAGPNGSR